MKYFLDEEFIEKPHTIELVSLALVCEDGRELYLEASDADLSQADEWIKTNVIAYLEGGNCAIPKAQFAARILEFIGDDQKPEIWSYFGSYDWVVFCWLFGRMIDLPKHFPKYTRDFKHYMDIFKIKKSDLPKQKNKHHALADARWLKEAAMAFSL